MEILLLETSILFTFAHLRSFMFTVSCTNVENDLAPVGESILNFLLFLAALFRIIFSLKLILLAIFCYFDLVTQVSQTRKRLEDCSDRCSVASRKHSAAQTFLMD